MNCQRDATAIRPATKLKKCRFRTDTSYKFQELGVFFPTLSASDTGTLTVVLNANSANGTVVADTIGAAQAWASTGGPTRFESEPSYQLSVQSSGFRTTPDVSFDASENSGVTTYYTRYNNSADTGLNYGSFGTSLSSPCWAGLIAIVNQGRVANGGTTLNSGGNPQQTLQALYGLPASDYRDITSGYNGLNAGPGYNEVTGLGTPVANLLVPNLVAYVPAPSVTSVSPTSGPATGGTTVTITGMNLGTASTATVDFGAAPAAIISDTGNQIVATSPAGNSGTVNVTVTTMGGGISAVTSSDQFTYGVVATQFFVTTAVSATLAGTAFDVTVNAVNASGVTAIYYAGTVHFTSSDKFASLPANATLTNGVAIFSATLRTAGSQALTVADSTNNSIIGSANITVSAAAIDRFGITTPASVAAGTPFNFTVAAQDVFGNTITGYTGTMQVLSTDPIAVLPAASTLSGGIGAFTATLNTAGTQNLFVTDTVASSIYGAAPTSRSAIRPRISS